MSVTLADVIFPTGAENLGGTGSTLYLCPWADIAGFPALPTITGPGDYIALATGDITCKTGKKFYKLYVTSETGMLKTEMVGPRDAKCFKNTYDMSTPGSKKEMLGTASALANTPLVAIIVENDGQMRIMGDSLIPAYLEKLDAQTGAKAEDGKFAKWELYSTGRQAYIYAGAIPLTPAS